MFGFFLHFFKKNSKLAKVCFFVKGKIRERNIDKMKLKMRTKFNSWQRSPQAICQTNNAAKFAIRLSR